ncbi:MAG TPA: hypothetical protein VLE43_00100 [Candidatus Saccharimonadia bacterium]|nr:hypothetical protein [Candidatus Saccharimonadia bacterium]
MSDPRNAAHNKKVAQVKKHKNAHEDPKGAHSGPASITSDAVPEGASAKASASLDSSLVVLGKLKEMEFHGRANLERLAELTLTVEDELKQKELSAPLGDVYSAQADLQSKLGAFIESYKAECDRLQGEVG